MAVRMNDAQCRLVTENINLVYGAIKRYNARNRLGWLIDFDDIVQVASMALCKAAMGYCGTKSAFSTYAYAAIKNALNAELKKHMKINEHEIVEIDTDVAFPANAFNIDVMPFNMERILDDAKKRHNGLIAKGIDVLMLRGSGFTLKEVAEMYNVPESCVSMWAIRAKGRLMSDEIFLDEVCI